MNIPFFILHFVFVWPLFVYRPNKFNFFGLSFGAIIADLEVPFLFLFVADPWEARSIMHSLLGALTINLIIVILATIYLVPIVLRYMDKKTENKKIFIFGRSDLREHKTTTTVVLYSGLIGTVSHLFLDALHHPYNPITFPVEKYYSFNLILFNNHQLANALVGLITIILFILMLYYWYVKNLL